MTAIGSWDRVALQDASPSEPDRSSVQEVNGAALRHRSSREAFPNPVLEASLPAEHIVEKGVPLGPLRARLDSTDELAVVGGSNWTIGSGDTTPDIAAADAPPDFQSSRPGGCVIGQFCTTDPGCEAAKEGLPAGAFLKDWNSATVPSGVSGGSATAIPNRIPPLAWRTDGGPGRKPVARGGRFRVGLQFARIQINSARFKPLHEQVGRFTFAVPQLAVAGAHVCALPGVPDKTWATVIPCHRVRAKTRWLAAEFELLPRPALSIPTLQANRDPSGNSPNSASCREPSATPISIARVAETARRTRVAPERLSRRDAVVPGNPENDVYSRCCTDPGRARSSDGSNGVGVGRVTTKRG